MRPSGKNHHNPTPLPLLSPAGKGSKTGLVNRRPFAFCCAVALRGDYFHPKTNGPLGAVWFWMIGRRFQFTASFNALAGLNFPPRFPDLEARKRGIWAAAILIVAPVCGLRPLRAERWPT